MMIRKIIPWPPYPRSQWPELKKQADELLDGLLSHLQLLIPRQRHERRIERRYERRLSHKT